MFTLGVDSSVELSELKVPLTVFGAIILAFGPKVFELFSGAKKAEQKEKIQTALTLSLLCSKLDGVIDAQNADKEEMKDMRKEVQALDIKVSTEVGKLYTALAGKENHQ